MRYVFYCNETPSYSYDWVETSTATTKRFRVAIVLLSGISTGKVSVCASEEVDTILLVVTWPDHFVDSRTCIQNGCCCNDSIVFEMFNKKLIGLEQFLLSCRLRDIDNIKNTVKHSFPFQL